MLNTHPHLFVIIEQGMFMSHRHFGTDHHHFYTDHHHFKNLSLLMNLRYYLSYYLIMQSLVEIFEKFTFFHKIIFLSLVQDEDLRELFSQLKKGE